MNDGIRTLTETDLGVLTTTKQTEFGAPGMTSDGRRYRYVSFGGTTTIAPGLVVTAAALTAAYQALAITATTVTAANQVAANLVAGATQIVLTNGATAVTQDQFAEGFIELIVGGASADTGTYSHKIRGNTLAAASGYITVFLAEPLRNTTAFVPGTDTANLNLNPFSTVNTSTTAAVPIGVTIIPVVNTASITNYGWVQTGGETVVLNDAGGTITVGGAFGQSVTTAGNVVAATASTHPMIGFTRIAISASTAGPAYLTLT
jgi:hypothetical protein